MIQGNKLPPVPLVLVSSYYFCLAVGTLISGASAEPARDEGEMAHLERLMEAEAQRLVAEHGGLDCAKNESQVLEMAEQMVFRLRSEIDGDDKRAEQLQVELAAELGMDELLFASSAGITNSHDGVINHHKRHRRWLEGSGGTIDRRLRILADPRGPRPNLIRPDRIQPKGLGILLTNQPAFNPHIVHRSQSLGENAIEELMSIGLKHSRTLQRLDPHNRIRYFQQNGHNKRRPSSVFDKRGQQDKKLVVTKSINHKLAWFKRLHVPLGILKSMPFIGDQVQKYLLIGEPFFKIVGGLSYLFQHIEQHLHRQEQTSFQSVGSPLRDDDDGDDDQEEKQQPAEVGADGAMLSEPAVKAVRSIVSTLLDRFDSNSSLLQKQQNELIFRVGGFIFGELAIKMTKKLLAG